MPEPAGNQPLLVVPDCNVLIHAKALRGLPWADLGRDFIEILIVGPVIAELDAVKTRPGRPGRRAREVSTEIRELLALPGHQDVLREARPRVTRRLWLGQKEGREPLREGLDLANGDQAIINRALWWLDSGREVIFLTDDTLAAANAQEFGLPYRLLPKDWLRPAEMDDAQKETQRLKTEIARLQASEPLLECWFEDPSGQKISRIDTILGRYEPLASELVDALVARVRAANPMVDFPPPIATKTSRPPGGPVDIALINEEWDGQFSPVMARAIIKYEEDYASWLEQVTGQLRDLHLRWRARREWPTVAFVGVNTGSRPASKALVEIVVSGDFKIRRPPKQGEVDNIDEKQRLAGLSIAMPPTPPNRATARLLGMGSRSMFERDPYRFAHTLPSFPGARDADAFYWRTGRAAPTDRMELECENWRHQREPHDFPLEIRGEETKSIEGLVMGMLSAANLTASVEAHLPVRITFADKPLEPIAEEMVAEFERVSARWRQAHKIPGPSDPAPG